MSDFPFTNFSDFYGHLFGLYQAHQFAQALDEATREQDRFPEFTALSYHFRACMASCAGDGPHAIRLLGEALARGIWYTEAYFDDDDFNPIRDDPEFQRVRARSLELYAAARTNARPVLDLHQPANSSQPYPLLLALHGNQLNNVVNGACWFPALDQGWMVGLVQSSQIVFPDSYAWDDREIREKELCDHYAAVCRDYPVNAQRVVIGGFSLGGEAAVVAALTGVLPARGFIAVTPGGPFTTQVEQYAPLIEAANGRGLRGGFIIGNQDRAADSTRTLVEMLRAGGIPCEVADYPDVGHQFPPDFDAQLVNILHFVTN